MFREIGILSLFLVVTGLIRADNYSGGLKEMTKYYMRWTMNPMAIPMNPEERVKLWMTMLEMVKADLKSGVMTDWGICSDLSAGYAFAETDEKSLHASILKWIPNIVFDIKPVITVDQSIANIKLAVAAKK